MNFCQDHHNHHCIHTHDCKNPQHQKHIEKKSLQQHNKTITNIQKRKKSNQKCTFTKSISHKPSKQANDQLLKLLHEKQIKVCELGHNELALKQRHDKLFQQNKHLYTQIEYYREQFAALIENSSQDNKNQIRKRVRQTTNFILKLNSLQSQNNTLKVQNTTLRDQLQGQRLLRAQNKHINETNQDKYNDIHSKLRATDKQKEEYRQQMLGKSNQFNRLKENYQILKKQFTNDFQKSKRTIKELISQLDSTKKQLSKLKGLTDKERQLLNIQISNYSKREQVLKQKLATFEANNKELFESIKELKSKNEQLEEDLYHAKKIIDKNQENTHQFANLQNQLHGKNVETNTIIKQHHHHQSSANKQNKPTLKDDEGVQALHVQIASLKEKIVELQKRNVTNYEQIILNMGASQAFKKLLDEKNGIIKKLMRQKGQIYAKMAFIHQQ